MCCHTSNKIINSGARKQQNFTKFIIVFSLLSATGASGLFLCFSASILVVGTIAVFVSDWNSC